MLSDYEIARQVSRHPISDIAARPAVESEDLMAYGDGIAKVNLKALTRPRKRPVAEQIELLPDGTVVCVG